jgi:hypothetical protein
MQIFFRAQKRGFIADKTLEYVFIRLGYLTGDTMQRLYFFISIPILTAFLAGCAVQATAQAEALKARENSTLINTATSEVVPHDPPVSCPITVPQDPLFIPPVPYDALGFKGEFWYGSSSLWTAVRENGIWEALPHNPNGYTQKVFWWRDGYIWTEEPQPALTVTGERLDAPAPPLHVSEATNASASDTGSAMLVGVDFPTPGCWKVTGKYADAEISFVVWVAP